MNILVAVVVYNRFDNLQKWVKCWKNSQQHGAKLVVIHNIDEKTNEKVYKHFCEANEVIYVSRPNKGFDIGAFQDVCKGRLKDFPAWDILLWVTDDNIPMSNDFLKPFLESISQPRIGVACMEISREVTPHIRTTGFCIKRSVAEKLEFLVDPILTKQDCYGFEHRWKDKTFYRQILSMGLKAEQISPLPTSPLWDTGSRKNLRRMAEHNQAFLKTDDKVTFICTIFNSYPQIISSLLCQTYKNWELILIHDGPNFTNLKSLVDSHKDPRIKYIETRERKGNYGHPIRKWALEELKEGRLSEPTYVVITNADNYHVPTYCEYMIKGFKDNPNAIAIYHDKMTHSYRAWDSQECRFERGYLDCAGVMVKKEAACEIGWNSIDHSADWFYFEDIAKKYGRSKFIKIKGNLLVHN